MPEIGFGLAVATAYYKNLCNSVQFHPRDEIGLNYINLLIIPGMALDRRRFARPDRALFDKNSWTQEVCVGR